MGLLPIAAVACGPLIGSFLAVLIVRLPRGRPVVFGRSVCDCCYHGLGFRDLIPFLSAIQTGFRCRYCDAQINPVHSLAEFAAFGIAIWAFLSASGIIVGLTCIFGWFLLALAVIDWRHLLLPDALTVPLAVAGIAGSAVMAPSSVVVHITGAVAGFGGMACLGFIYRQLRGRDGLGLGDAKLLGAIGAWVSVDGIASVLLIGAAMGLVTAGALAFSGTKVTASTKLPFGTFLSAAGWLVWLYGPVQFTWL